MLPMPEREKLKITRTPAFKLNIAILCEPNALESGGSQ